MYKDPYQVCWGKDIKYGRGEGNIKGVGKNITCNNGKWTEKSSGEEGEGSCNFFFF